MDINANITSSIRPKATQARPENALSSRPRPRDYEHARALYERCGFALTGEHQPLPSDPSLGEVAMSRTLP
jgi:hypothetical protein